MHARYDLKAIESAMNVRPSASTSGPAMADSIGSADDSARKISKGKRYGDDLPEPDRSAPFKPKPTKEIDGRRFDNVDPRKEWSSVPSNALRKYDKKHYDGGGDYDHWDEDKSYWRLSKDRPMV